MIEKIYGIQFGIHTLMNLLFSVFLFFAVLMPADSHNIKLFIFIILLTINFTTILNFVFRKENSYLVFISIIFPVIMLIISTSITGLYSDTLRFFYVFTYILLIPIVEKYRIDFLKIFIWCLYFIAIVIVISSILDFIGVLDIYSNPILQFLHNNGEAKVSKSVNALFYYVIFLNASPLLTILFTYSLHKDKKIMMFFSFLALLFSGTRANIYVAFIVFFIYVFFINKNVALKVVLSLISLLVIMLFGGKFINQIAVINDAKSSGDEIRRLNINSILISMKQNPISYLWGNGAMSSYFSLGRNEYVNGSELSYLELVRQIGLLGTIPFIHFIFKPLKKLYLNKETSWITVAYLSYLVVAIVDPFLFTSTGFMFYALIYYEYRIIEKGDVENVLHF